MQDWPRFFEMFSALLFTECIDGHYSDSLSNTLILSLSLSLS
mgnify:CR=1 FL=1